MIKTNKNSLALNNWGIGISLVCCVHCAIMPLIFISSAFLGAQIEILERVELPMFILAAFIGSISVFQAYFKLKDLKPALFVLIGILLIVIGGNVVGVLAETMFRVLGSLFIVCGHVVSKRIQKKQPA